MKNKSIPACSIDTPENFFIPNPNVDDIPHNAVRCALSRAKAVLELVMDNGHDLKTGFMVSQATLMDALWCLSGILDQVETMLDCPIKKGETHNDGR